MEQFTKNLSLIPTKYPHVFNVQLKLDHETRYIGKLDKAGEGTFSTKRTPKLLFRKTNSLGINLELLQRFDFKWIVISYCGKRLVTTKNYFLSHGKVFTFRKAGFEEQCFLPLDLWGAERAIAYERSVCSQAELFSNVA